MDPVAITTLALVITIGLEKIIAHLGWDLSGIKHLNTKLACSKCMTAELNISRNASTTGTHAPQGTRSVSPRQVTISEVDPKHIGSRRFTDV